MKRKNDLQMTPGAQSKMNQTTQLTQTKGQAQPKLLEAFC